MVFNLSIFFIQTKVDPSALIYPHHACSHPYDPRLTLKIHYPNSTSYIFNQYLFTYTLLYQITIHFKKIISMRYFFLHILHCQLHISLSITSPLQPRVKSLFIMSRYFLKFYLAVAYRILSFRGALSEFQLTKISLLIGMLSLLVNSKSKTAYRYLFSGRALRKSSQD